MGLRVSAKEEIAGLDSCEHNLASAYAGFDFTDNTSDEYLADHPELMHEASAPSVAKVAAPAAPSTPAAYVSARTSNEKTPKLTKVAMVISRDRFEPLKTALNAIGVTGITVTDVMGCGTQKGRTAMYRGTEYEITLLPKCKVEVVVSAVPVQTVVETAEKVLRTGNFGDGKIFVYDVENVIRVRTGEEGFDALQDAND